MHKGLLDRESLRAEDGVKYFKDTLRPHVIKGAQNGFLQRFSQFIRARRENMDMVSWIGMLSLLLKRLRDTWMDMFPMSAMSETRKQNQYLADVTRNEAMLDPDSPETRDRWNATEVTTHQRLFPFDDNLTTLMFIVSSHLSEAQRERLTSSLSLQGVNVTAFTFVAVRTVFVELFCTPKSSMDNPSLRVNRSGGNIDRTFIVVDCIEDEFGQWATDEVNGEQGYVDDERSCFWTWGNNESAWKPRPFWSRKLKKKEKGKRKGKDGSKGAGRAFLGEVQAQESELWSEEDCAWWSIEYEARKAFQKVVQAFGRVGFAVNHQKRGQAMILTRTKAEARIKKGKG